MRVVRGGGSVITRPWWRYPQAGRTWAPGSATCVHVSAMRMVVLRTLSYGGQPGSTVQRLRPPGELVDVRTRRGVLGGGGGGPPGEQQIDARVGTHCRPSRRVFQPTWSTCRWVLTTMSTSSGRTPALRDSPGSRCPDSSTPARRAGACGCPPRCRREWSCPRCAGPGSVSRTVRYRCRGRRSQGPARRHCRSIPPPGRFAAESSSGRAMGGIRHLTAVTDRGGRRHR